LAHQEEPSVKLFQIEEPDGSPGDREAPGAAIGIDASGKQAEIACAVGGNAVILADREGFARDLPVPELDAPAEAWQALFEGARIRAERSLARPVTHAVLAIAKEPDAATLARLRQAAASGGLELLLAVKWDHFSLAASGRASIGAAMIAEDTAPRPQAS
jgi:hypothetical protein